MIVKTGNRFTVKGQSGRKMGTYGSKAKAEKRLKQIEYFKSRGSKANSGP